MNSRYHMLSVLVPIASTGALGGVHNFPSDSFGSITETLSVGTCINEDSDDLR